jgi:hypothetical protein
MMTMIVHFMLGLFLGGLAVSTVVPPKSNTAKQLRIASFSSGGFFLLSSIANKMMHATVNSAQNTDELAHVVLLGLLSSVILGLTFIAIRKSESNVKNTQKI